MDTSLQIPLFTVLGTLIGGLITFAVNRQQFKHQLASIRQQNKPTLWQKHLGGFCYRVMDEQIEKIIER